MKKANAQNSRPNKSQVLTEFLKGLLAQGPVGVPEIEDMAEGGWTPGQKAIDHALEAVSCGEEGPWHPVYSGWLCNRRQVVLAFAGRCDAPSQFSGSKIDGTYPFCLDGGYRSTGT